MKNLLLVFVVAFFSCQAMAQINLDSLWTIWNDQSQPDTSRLKAINRIAWDGYLFSQPDSAYYFAQLHFEFADSRGLKKSMASALNTQGVSFVLRGNYPEALKHYQKSLSIQEEIDNKAGISTLLGNIGLIYADQHNYSEALNYYHRSLEFKDKHGLHHTFNNIGGVYQEQGNYDKALEYHQKSLAICEELDRKQGKANSLGNIGMIYAKQGKMSEALETYQASLVIREELDDKYGIAHSLSNIGSIHLEQGDVSSALRYCKSGYDLAQSIGVLELQKTACECLYEANKLSGNGNAALVYLENANLINDSLKAEETAKKLQQMEFQKEMMADSIANAEEARLVEEAHKEEVRKKNRTRNIAIGGGLFLFLIAGGIYSRLRYTRKAKAAIEKEKDRSENLLLNILPADIAAELKEKGRADARDFEKVSILFTDFKGFTAASEKLSAQDLVTEINTCFEAFDGIMGKYGIEKIKTIGDAYMAAGGLPVPTNDSVRNTVLAALELQDFIQARKAKLDAEGKPGFEMRVGVHTGPVVAGIVGVKKFQYDIWGDTVNTASRMESSGEVGKVNISEATYELLKDDSQFAFESRGKVKAKGKGEMEMYFASQIG